MFTETERNPVVALAATVILAVSWVVPVMVREFTVTPAPKFTVVMPE